MSTLECFHLFTSLPSELRIKIWKQTFPEPRVVPIRFNRAGNRYTTTTQPSHLLHICPESRELYLQTYTKLILSPKYESSIYIDFAHDTLFFDSLDCSPDGDLSHDLARSPHRDRILRCAIDAQLWEVLRVFKYENLSEVKLMRNLKVVALVMARDWGRDTLGVAGEETAGSDRGFMQVDSNTVRTEIRHVHWYVESLRWEIEHGLIAKWENGPPNVQMWLW